MRFDFATARRIIFGVGVVSQVGSLAASLGRRALITGGATEERSAVLHRFLQENGIVWTYYSVPGEPTVPLIEQGIEVARRESCDMVIGFGGGSAIDAGKAIAMMLANQGEIIDYLEVIGRGRPFEKASLPFIAVPTTAGTGSEVTRNAVLGSPEDSVKASLRSPFMLPSVALVDPELTYGLPPHITAYTGMDALTQLIEPYTAKRANALTDALCLDGIGRVARSLRRAYEDGEDAAAREDMALASLFGGIALANAGLGAVHGFAGPFGGMYAAPHGAICARLLAPVVEANIRALRQRRRENGVLQRYIEIARSLTGDAGAQAMDGVAWLSELASALVIPGLSGYGLRRSDYERLIEKASVASSMRSNPIELSPSEMATILEKAI